MSKIAIGLFILLWIQIFFIEKVASACNCVSDGSCNGNCGDSCFYVRKFNPVFNSELIRSNCYPKIKLKISSKNINQLASFFDDTNILDRYSTF